MNLTGGIILFTVIWFMIFLMILPVRMISQAQAGEVVPGTPASAPAEAHIAKKARITTIISLILWVVIAAVLAFGGFTIRDIDWFHRLDPVAPAATVN